MAGSPGRLRARGGSGDVATSHQRAGGLQGHAAPPGLGLEREFPATGGNLLDAAGNPQKRKRQFLVEKFEIDTTIVDFDFLQTVGWSLRRLRAIDSRGVACNRLRWRKPALEIPVALVVSHQDQTGARQGKRTELEMTAPQTSPAQASGQAFGAKKVFVPERRIFAHSDLFGV